MSAQVRDDVALKLLHTADWHLGMKFPSFSADAQRTLTRARMSAVDRILGLAQSNRVDAVLCAGDLFDDPQPEDTWWQGLLERLRVHDWSQRPVFLLPGNHDPLTPTSVYHPSHAFRRGLPPGVAVIDRDDFTAPLSEHATLFATPCRNTAGQTGLWEHLPGRPAGDASIRVGMVHGQTVDIPGCEINFPIPPDAASRRGMDYLAIGDTHAFRDVAPPQAAPAVYPSAPEATRFGEVDTGFVALVFFPAGGRRPLIRRERVGHWIWEERRVTSLAELRSLGEEEGLSRKVMRLRLSMRLDAESFETAEELLRTLEGTDATHGRVGVLQVDRSELALDTAGIDELLDDLPDTLRSVVARLRARETGEASDPAKRALFQLYRLVREAR